MVTDHCTICARTLRPAEDGAHACTACTHRIRGWLTDLPRQLPYLEASLRLDGGTTQGRPSGRAHAPLPLRLDVLSLLGPGQLLLVHDPHGDQTDEVPLTTMLIGWAQYIAEQHPAVVVDRAGEGHIAPCEGPWPRSGHSVAGWCRWLAAYLPYAVTQPWIGELHEQLQDLLGRCRAITRLAPGRRPQLAPCPRCEMFALVARDDEWETICENCNLRLDPDAYAAHASVTLRALTPFMVAVAVRNSPEVAA